MEINSANLFKSYMQLAYRSFNAVETLYNQRIQGVTRKFLTKLLQNQVLLDKVAHGHPQYEAVLKIRQFLEEDEKEEQDPVYYETCFYRFVTSMITFCEDLVYPFIKSNQPLEYAWFEISPNGKDIAMKQNTFQSIGVPLRVKFNRTETYSFDLSNGVRLKTPRGDFLCVNGKKCIVTAPASNLEFVVILTKGKEKKVFYNDGERLKVWQCGYLYYD